MKHDKNGQLDLEGNYTILCNIAIGEKESFQKLESWYEERILDKNRPIESNERGFFKIMEFVYNLNVKKNKEEKEAFNKKKEENKIISLHDDGANSNITLESIVKQINELKLKDEEKTNEINELKQKDEEKTNKINELRQKDEAILKDQLILSSKNDIVKFINDVQIFINKEKIYYNSIKIYCLNQKYELNEVDIVILKALTLELYSFKNLSFYRKICFLLLKEIILENEKNIKYEGYFKVTNGNIQLKSILSYLFWAKDSISKLLHFSISARDFFKDIIATSNKEELKLKDIENIKNIDEFYGGLGDYTNRSLIDCLDLSRPILFFGQKGFNKENTNMFIENLTNLLAKIEKNKDGENNEFHSKLLDLNRQIEKISNNIYVKDIKDKKLIEEYNENVNYVKTKSNFEKEIKNIEKMKNNILEGTKEALKYKKKIKTNYFTFRDFTKYYIQLKNLKNFNPSLICRELLKNRLDKKINFEESDDQKLEELLLDKKKLNPSA